MPKKEETADTTFQYLTDVAATRRQYTGRETSINKS